MNNTKTNNIIESLNERRYITYTFPSRQEASEFCRDNHINTGEINFDGEYYTLDVLDKSSSVINKNRDIKDKKQRTEYIVSFKAIDRDDTVYYHDKEKVPAYSLKQAKSYLNKIYREKGYIIRDFKVDGTRVLDNAGFVDRKNIEV